MGLSSAYPGGRSTTNHGHSIEKLHGALELRDSYTKFPPLPLHKWARDWATGRGRQRLKVTKAELGLPNGEGQTNPARSVREGVWEPEITDLQAYSPTLPHFLVSQGIRTPDRMSWNGDYHAISGWSNRPQAAQPEAIGRGIEAFQFRAWTQRLLGVSEIISTLEDSCVYRWTQWEMNITKTFQEI